MSVLEAPQTLRDLAASSFAVLASVRPDVVLDLPRSRHMSAGMRAYAEALALRIPGLDPELHVRTIVRGTTASLSEQLVLPGALARLGGRLVHHLSPYAPILGPMPFVVTVHDLVHLRYPQYFKRSVATYYDAIVRRVCAAAARVIVDDERTIGDLALYLDVDPEKVAVIPLGIDDAFRADGVAPFENAGADGAPKPYLLYVGNHREHKDLPTLFAAWASLPESFALDLLVTGPNDFAGTPLPWRRDGALRVLGEVPAEALPALYRGATALVHPALCEGFGLPIAEAAAVGTRVIACEDATPGVLAPFVETFAPHDHRALARAIRRPADAARVGEARRVAAGLTWDRCARATVEVYRDVLAQSLA